MWSQKSNESVSTIFRYSVSIATGLLLSVFTGEVAVSQDPADLRVVSWRGPWEVAGQRSTLEYTLIPLDGYTLLGKTGVLVSRGIDAAGNTTPQSAADYRMTQMPGGKFQLVIWWSKTSVEVAELNADADVVNFRITGHSGDPTQVGSTAKLRLVKLEGDFGRMIYDYAAGVRKGEREKLLRILNL